MKNCSDWCSAAFGFNNPAVVQWLRDAASFSPELAAIESKSVAQVNILQAQVGEFKYQLAQEKAMRFTGASKLQAQEKNQKAVIKELRKAFSADNKQLLKEKEQALKEKEQVKGKYEKMEGTAQEWEVRMLSSSLLPHFSHCLCRRTLSMCRESVLQKR